MRFVLPLFLLACQDYSLEKVQEEEGAGPAMDVAPNPLVFGSMPAGEEDAKVFTITSAGSATLTVTGVEILTADSSFAITSPVVEGRLGPGETMDIVVTWTSTGGEAADQAVVHSSDVDDAIVDLVGGALIPQLTITPSDVDFGTVAANATATEMVTLTNTGQALLTVSDLSVSDNVFGWEGVSAPLELDVGESADVTVTFSPTAEGVYTGSLDVESDDPDGVKSALLHGEVGSQPIAVCSVDPATIEAIHEEADWIGEDSYDPQGYAITEYRWTLVSKPSGSAATMPSGSGSNRRGFTADVVGIYEGQLVVVNEIGDVSEPCTTELEAIPGGDFWIEMFWTHADDDMDLHLLAPGGSFNDGSKDCYYANCVGTGLDWGVRGDASDNPSLDLDDIPGTGPENINISDPDAGTYTVLVHDYTGSTPDYQGGNDVTVNVYVGGVLKWTDTRTISGDGSKEKFCEVEFPGGTVTPL